VIAKTLTMSALQPGFFKNNLYVTLFFC